MAESWVPVSNVMNALFSYSGTTLTVSWDGFGDSYAIRYRTADTNWSVPIITPTSPITIEGLTEGETYEFEFITTAGSYITQGTYMGFVIPTGAEPPTNIRFTSITPTTASIAWDGPYGTYAVIWVNDLGQMSYDFVDGFNNYTIREIPVGQNLKIYVNRYSGAEQIVMDGGVYLDLKQACCVTIDEPVPPPPTTSATTTVPGVGDELTLTVFTLGQTEFNIFADPGTSETMLSINGLENFAPEDYHIEHVGGDWILVWHNAYPLKTTFILKFIKF